jgi:hypothetical protein
MTTLGLDRSLAGNFVLVRVDTVMLLVPLEGLGAAFYLDQEPVRTEVPGLFSLGEGEQRRLVVAPSGGLRPLSQYPSDRFVMTPVPFDGNEIFIAWSDVKVLIGTRLQLRPLPPLLADPDGPFDGYVLFDGRPAFHSTARQVVDFIFSGAGPDD